MQTIDAEVIEWKKSIPPGSNMFDEYTSFQSALTLFKDSDFIHIATGDWAYVFKKLSSNEIIRITPYDPAYLHFAQLCYSNPHPNLPHILKIQPLSRSAYAVIMPVYEAGTDNARTWFIDSVKRIFSSNTTSSSELSVLEDILKIGCVSGKESIPYFSGIDWNPDNIVFHDSTPIFLDAFYLNGEDITNAIKSGASIALSADERTDFLTIPFFNSTL